MASMIPRPMTIRQIYNACGLMYISYACKIDDRDNGQIIAGNTPTYSMMNKQVEKSLVVVVFIAYWWGVNSSPINMLSFKTLIIRLKLIPKKD